MIDKKELRIGNKVNIIDRSNEVHLVNPFVFKIVEIKAFTVSLILSATKDYSTPQYIEVKYSDISPIPLTEELLVKCGFEKTSIDYLFKLKYGRYSEFITYDLDDNHYSIQDEISWQDIPIKSLHQLQNLFYCLCNQELTIEI